MNFETALAELEDIVEKLESGKVDLEASIAIYERGEALKKHCERLLKDAEARIEKITLKTRRHAVGHRALWTWSDARSASMKRWSRAASIRPARGPAMRSCAARCTCRGVIATKPAQPVSPRRRHRNRR